MPQPELELIPCNLCGAQDTVPEYVFDGLTIAHCRRCQLVYANPRLTLAEIWKRYSSTYFWNEYMPAHDAADGKYVEAWHKQRALPMLNLLQPFRSTGELLEIGCAAGFFLKIAEEQGWRPTGVEIMTSAVEYARLQLQLNVIEGTLEQAHFANDRFDAVVMIETIEHLLDPAAVLRETGRVLRPGGVLWLTTPNFNSLMRHILGSAWTVLSPAEHVYYFTATTLAGMLRSAGFREVRFIWRLPGNSIWDTLNPYNVRWPDGWRKRLLIRSLEINGWWLQRIVTRLKRSDRLMALAIK